MKPQRIALVSDAVLPFNKGGKETRIDYLARELASLGYDVHIYTMHWWDGGKTTHIGDLTYHAISPLYPLYDGERRSIREGVLFGLACFKLLGATFDILEVDHMPFFPLFSAKVVALVRRKPLYATWHEVWGAAYWQEYLGGLNGRIAALIEALSIRMPNHITVVSRYTYNQLRTVLGYTGSLSLVSNGIDYKRIHQVPASPTKYDVLFAGRLLAHKNIDVLIRAIALLTKNFPNIRCAIIGGGPELLRLTALVDELGLDANVKLLGFLESNDSIYAAMKSSRVFVLPSSREGFGISLLEAAACGASVITVDEPENAAKDLAPELGGAVVALSPEALATAIEQSMHPNGTPVAIGRDYDWGTLAVKMREVYGV